MVLGTSKTRSLNIREEARGIAGYAAVALIAMIIGAILGVILVSLGWSLTVDVSPQTINTVLGVILGFAASLGVQSIVRRRQRAATTRNLRRALVAELTSMDGFFNIFNQNTNYNHPAAKHTAENISTNVYEGNIHKLGGLSPVETQAVVLYYSSLSNVRAMIRASSEADGAMSDTEFPEEIVIRLNAVWRLVLGLLRAKIQPKYRPPERELVNIGEGKSIDEDNTLYDQIQNELLQGGDIDEEKAERLIEDALSRGEVLSDTHTHLKHALEEGDTSVQRNMPTEEGMQTVEVNTHKPKD